MKSRREKQRFSIRKYNVGVASVLIATAFSVMQAGNVQAEETSALVSSTVEASKDDSNSGGSEKVSVEDTTEVSSTNSNLDFTTVSSSNDEVTDASKNDEVTDTSKNDEVTDASKTELTTSVKSADTDETSVSVKKEVLEQVSSEANVISAFVDKVVSNNTVADGTSAIPEETKSDLKTISTQLAESSKASEVILSDTEVTDLSLSNQISTITSQIQAAYVLLKKIGYTEITYVLDDTTSVPESDPYAGMTKIGDKFYASAHIEKGVNGKKYNYTVKAINDKITNGDELIIEFNELVNPNQGSTGNAAPQYIYGDDGTTVIAEAKKDSSGRYIVPTSWTVKGGNGNQNNPYFAQRDGLKTIEEKQAEHIPVSGDSYKVTYVFNDKASKYKNVKLEGFVDVNAAVPYPKVASDKEVNSSIKINGVELDTENRKIKGETIRETHVTNPTQISLQGDLILDNDGNIVSNSTGYVTLAANGYDYNPGSTFTVKLKNNEMTKFVVTDPSKIGKVNTATVNNYKPSDLVVNENDVYLYPESKKSEVQFKIQDVSEDSITFVLVSGTVKNNVNYDLKDLGYYGVKREVTSGTLGFRKDNTVGYSLEGGKREDFSDEGTYTTSVDENGNVQGKDVKYNNIWVIKKPGSAGSVSEADLGVVALRFVKEDGTNVISPKSIVPSGNPNIDKYITTNPTNKTYVESSVGLNSDQKVEITSEKTAISQDNNKYTVTAVPPYLIKDSDGKYYEFVKYSDAGVSYTYGNSNYKSAEHDGSVENGLKNVVAIYKEAKYGVVKVRYINSNDEELKEQTTIHNGRTDLNNIVGNKYDTTKVVATPPTELTDANGLVYTLSKVPSDAPTNTSGVITEEPIIVTYKYVAKVGGDVKVAYEDESGNKIADTVTIADDSQVGKDYDTSSAKKSEITKDGVTYVLSEKPIKTGSATETGKVTEAEQTVTYVYIAKQKANVVYKNITKNTTLETQALADGKPGETITYADNADKIAYYQSKGYELVNDGFDKATTYDNVNSNIQEITVTFKEGTTPVDPNNPDWPGNASDSAKKTELTKSVTRKIIYVDSTTNQEIADSNSQTVSFTRTPILSKVTGEITGYDTNGDGVVDTTDADAAWVTKNNQFTEVVSPDLSAKGYNAPDQASVVSQIVKASDSDSSVVVKYKQANGTVTPGNKPKPGEPVDPNNPNGPKWPDSVKDLVTTDDVTRTIKYVYAKDNSQASDTVTQTANFKRGATVNLVTGAITYGDWTSENSTLASKTSPVITGYLADTKEVASKTVVAEGADETVTVSYTAIGSFTPKVPEGYTPVTPIVYPNDPTDPTKPGVPTTPIPNVPGLTPVGPNGPLTPVDPSDPSKGYNPPSIPTNPGEDTPITYVKDGQIAVINYVTESGEVLSSDSVSGKSGEVIDYSTASKIQDYISKGYELVSDNFPTGTSYDNDTSVTQTFTVVLKEANGTVIPGNEPKPGEPVDPNNPNGPKWPDSVSDLVTTKDVTRTIKYVDSNGNVVSKEVVQTVNFKRGATVNLVTGAITYGDWTSSDSTLPEVVSPDLSAKGYDAPDQAKVSSKTVTATDEDSTVVVTYPQGTMPVDPKNPVWPDSASDATKKTELTKTIKRTIKYVDSNGNVVSEEVVQTVEFTRTPIVNKVTGEIVGYDTDGDGKVDTTDGSAAWVTPNNTLPEVVSPDLSAKGYDAPDQAKVSSKTVTATDEDSTVVVTYKMKAKEEPKKPSKDDSNKKNPKHDGDKDNTPKHDDNTNKTPKHDENKTPKDGDNGKHHVEDRKVTSEKPSASNGMMRSTSEQVLPNTGETSPSALSVLGAMALIGGLFAAKRRKDEQ